MDSEGDYVVDDASSLDSRSASETSQKIDPKQHLAADADARLYVARSDDDDLEDGTDSGSGFQGQPSLLRKRPALEADADGGMFKRHRGNLNHDYLNVLNQDIEDAAHRVCVADDALLSSSRLGLTPWSSLEKQQFFAALARLGRHNLPAITARIGSKSLIEVQHYMASLLDDLRLRSRCSRRIAVELAEIPAAVEFSQPCCHAQEEAADIISLKQEQVEAAREEEKWGRYWDVTPAVAEQLDRGDVSVDSPPRAVELFHLENWIELSARLFMNSSIPSNNWYFVGNEMPSMWATTFDDFYALAVSVTRRLVQATLFVSMSRIRAKREVVPTTRNYVRKRDVEAAIASLGMAPNAQSLWLGCARRLRLAVYLDPPYRHREEEEPPMSYEAVEAALAGKELPDSDEQLDMDADMWEPVGGDDETNSKHNPGGSTNTGDRDSSSSEYRETDCEANEVLRYSATDLRDLADTRQALRLRIRAEKKQEEFADRCDMYASHEAESQMWNILRRKPPVSLPKKQDPGQPERSSLEMESMLPPANDWASQTRYCAEWEADDQPVEATE